MKQQLHISASQKSVNHINLSAMSLISGNISVLKNMKHGVRGRECEKYSSGSLISATLYIISKTLIAQYPHKFKKIVQRVV